MKKGRLTILFLVGCLVFLPGGVYAKTKNYICSVDQVGSVGNNPIRVMLTHERGQFTQKWFQTKTSRQKEMLAILLSAIYGDMSVKIKVDINKKSVPEIENLLIIAP